MKKTIVALLLGTLVLSGCGWLHSDKSWKNAKQENPLEIPPNMNRPDVSDALSIPTVNAQQEQSSSTPATPNRLHLNSDVESTYKRVGLVLGNGDIGNVLSHSDSKHTYTVAMTPKMQIGSSQSFMQRHFSNAQGAGGSQDAAAAGSGASAGTATGPRVQVQVSPSAGGGSDVSASGDPQAVANLMSALKARLGG